MSDYSDRSGWQGQVAEGVEGRTDVRGNWHLSGGKAEDIVLDDSEPVGNDEGAESARDIEILIWRWLP